MSRAIKDPELLETMKELAYMHIQKETKTLADILKIVADATDIDVSNGVVNTQMRLSSADLEAICLRIPAECAFLQAAMTNFNIKLMFSELEIEDKVTTHLASMKGGNAVERMRIAEQQEYKAMVINAVNKTVAKGIQGYIERADKTYEAIKKVLDYRSKEGWFDRKGV